MNSPKPLTILMVFLAFAGWGEAAVETDERPDVAETVIHLSVGLADGSRLIGIPRVTTLVVESPYAVIDIPMDQIRTVTVEKDNASAVFEMANGDCIKGALTIKTLDLQTAFGTVAVGAGLINTIRVIANNDGGAGPILWNRLGCLRDVTRSERGVNGIAEGPIAFAPVGRGNGVALQAGHSRVVFNRPFGNAFPEAGCIEFWWTPAHNEDSSTGSHHAERFPFILSSEQAMPGGWPAVEVFLMYRTHHPNAANRTVVYFQAFDEITGRIAACICAYELDFMAGQPMHLALSWNTEWGHRGMKLFKDGDEVPLAYANDQAHGGREDIRPVIDLIRRRLPNLTYDLGLLRRSRRPDGAANQFDEEMRMRDLKIWGYGKTDFFDRQ